MRVFTQLFLLLLLLGANAPSKAGNRALRGTQGRVQPLPLYMMNLYRSVHQAGRRVKAAGAETWEPPIPGAEIIRSLVPNDFHQTGGRWILAFDLSPLDQEEELQQAELRLRWPGLSGQTDPATNITIDLFHRKGASESKKHPTCQVDLYLGSVLALKSPSRSSSWITLNSTKLLLDAIKDLWHGRTPHGGAYPGLPLQGRQDTQSLNLGLPLQGRQDTLSPKLHGGQSKPGTMAYQALMVVFSTVSGERRISSGLSLQHLAEHSKYIAQGIPELNAEQITTPAEKTKRLRRNKLKNRLMELQTLQGAHSKLLCHKVDFYVDFEDIGWGSWIVHPKRYNAYRCEGECPSPLSDILKPTNHAYMQSLLKFYIPDRVPSPCCSPARMRPLSMLYYEERHVVLHHHKEMIVEECGCH